MEGLNLLQLNNNFEASNENCIGTSLKYPCCFQALENFLTKLFFYLILGIEFPKQLSLNQGSKEYLEQ